MSSHCGGIIIGGKKLPVSYEYKHYFVLHTSYEVAAQVSQTQHGGTKYNAAAQSKLKRGTTKSSLGAVPARDLPDRVSPSYNMRKKHKDKQEHVQTQEPTPIVTAPAYNTFIHSYQVHYDYTKYNHGFSSFCDQTTAVCSTKKKFQRRAN